MNQNKEKLLTYLTTINETAYSIKQLIENDKAIYNDELTLMSVKEIEAMFVKISKLIDYDNEIKKDNDKRYEILNEKNKQIQELKSIIGANPNTKQLSLQLKTLESIISTWWSNHGFHYIYKEEPMFTGSDQTKIKFGFMLDEVGRNRKNKTNENKERIAAFINEGYDIVFEYDDRHPQLVDNDNNRHKVMTLIKNRFPSAVVFNTENIHHNIKGEQKFVMSAISVYLDMCDITEE